MVQSVRGSLRDSIRVLRSVPDKAAHASRSAIRQRLFDLAEDHDGVEYYSALISDARDLYRLDARVGASFTLGQLAAMYREHGGPHFYVPIVGRATYDFRRGGDSDFEREMRNKFGRTAALQWDDGIDDYQSTKRTTQIPESIQWDQMRLRLEDWMSAEFDPENPNTPLLPKKLIPGAGTAVWNRMTQKERLALAHASLAYFIDQIKVGEYGALNTSALLATQSPDQWTKESMAAQAYDEARHVRVFSKLAEGLDKPYEPSRELFATLFAMMAGQPWDVQAIGMNAIVEGVAMGIFGKLFKHAGDQTVRSVLFYVKQDEARHVDTGRAMNRVYFGPESQISDRERQYRENWAYAACEMMRKRFYAEHIWREFFSHAMSLRAWKRDENVQAFIDEMMTAIFRNVIPNLTERSANLITDRMKPLYYERGLMRYMD